MSSGVFEITKKLIFIVTYIGPTVVVICADLFLYPFSRYILPHLKYKQNVWIQFIIGFSLSIFIFRYQTIIPIVMAFVQYFLLDLNPLYEIIVSFLFSSAVHIYCMVTISKGWQWMVNSITMIMFQKGWMTAVDIYYGKKMKNDEKIRPALKQTSLPGKPPLLEWLTYCFTPFGAFSGPITCFKVQQYTFGVGERPRISDDSKSHKEARRKFYLTFLLIVLSYISMKYGNISFYYSPLYLNAPLPLKVVLMVFCGLLHTIKYYSAWHSVEAGVYETGVAEAGIVAFDGVSNLTVWEVLMSDSNGIWLQRWNHSAHLFWKHYLLYPLLDKGVKYSYANYSTFIGSALWHGFYPVYYMLLPEMLAASTADRLINGMFPDILTKGNIFVRIIYRFWIWMSMMVPTSTWWYRSAEAFIYCRKSQKFLGPILIFVVLIVAKILTFFIPIKSKPRKVPNPSNPPKEPKEEAPKDKEETKKEKEDEKEKID